MYIQNIVVFYAYIINSFDIYQISKYKIKNIGYYLINISEKKIFLYKNIVFKSYIYISILQINTIQSK